MRKRKKEKEDGRTPKRGRPTILSEADAQGLKRWVEDHAFRGQGKTFPDIQAEVHRCQRNIAIRNGYNGRYLELASDSAIHELISKWGLQSTIVVN